MLKSEQNLRAVSVIGFYNERAFRIHDTHLKLISSNELKNY
jgi:hypothetical protein